jgi:hypothetical protein
LAQQLHTQHTGVKVYRTLQIANAQHGVEKSHGGHLKKQSADDRDNCGFVQVAQ